MKKRHILTLTALCLLCLLLCACSGLNFRNEKLEAQLVKFLECVETNDADGFIALIQTDDMSAEELEALFSGIREYWPDARSTDPYTVQGLSDRVDLGSDGQTEMIDGIIQVNSASGHYVVTMQIVDDGTGSAITRLHVVSEAEFGEANTETVPQPIGTVLTVLTFVCYGFVIITVVDICKQKPKKYGLWILIALVNVGVILSVSGSSMLTNFQFNFLSTLSISQSAANGFRLTLILPIGSVVCWCMRKKRIAEKEGSAAEQIPTVPVEPVE